VTKCYHAHAPLQTKEIKIKSSAPWFDGEYRQLRRQRRKSERRYRKNKLDADKEEYVRLRKQTTETAKAKKISYVSRKLEEGSSKTLFTVVSNLLDSEKVAVLPSAKSEKELANSFLSYFQQKIEKIREKFPKRGKSLNSTDAYTGTQLLSDFAPASEDEIREIITSHKVKCSPEDPLPAGMLTTHLDTLLPYWLEMVNLSLEVGSMDALKSAVIIPLIKELNSMTEL
jgi:hypothetical protein